MQSGTSTYVQPQASGLESKTTLTRFVEATLVWTCLLTTSGYALLSVPGYNFHLLLVALMTYVGLSLSLVARLQVLAEPKIAMSYLLLLVGGGLLATIANADAGNVSSFVKFALAASAAYMLTCYIQPKVFLAQFVYVMSGLAAISLVVYVAVNFLGVNLPLPTVVNATGMPYRVGVLFFVFDNHLTFRNTGPFWEPGIFGTYLSLALLATTQIDRHRLLCRSILLIALVSTVSTASTLFLMILIGVYAISRVQRPWLSALWWNLAFVVVVVFLLNLDTVFGVLADIWPRVFSKFTAAHSASLLERMTSPVVNLQIFHDNPLFGLGLNEAIEEYQRLTFVSQTSTVTFLFAAIGIVGAAYCIAVLHGVFRQSSLSVLARIAVAILVLSAINKEPHYYFTLTYVLLFYSVQTTFPRRDTRNG